MAKDFLATLRSSGAARVEVDLAEILELNAKVSFTVALYEAMRDLPAYLEAADHGLTPADIITGIGGPDVRAVFESQLGEHAISEAHYSTAIGEQRPRLRRLHIERLSNAGLHALVFPSNPMTARPIGEDETVELNDVRVPTFASYVANVDFGGNVGAPWISPPIGLSNGLPVGIELDAAIGRDERLLTLAESVGVVLPRTPAPSGF